MALMALRYFYQFMYEFDLFPPLLGPLIKFAPGPLKS
jgi:hypothetical protein